MACGESDLAMMFGLDDTGDKLVPITTCQSNCLNCEAPVAGILDEPNRKCWVSIPVNSVFKCQTGTGCQHEGPVEEFMVGDGTSLVLKCPSCGEKQESISVLETPSSVEVAERGSWE